MTAKKVFITGGAGFIGHHVVTQLLDKGYEIVIFDNMVRGDRDRANALTSTGRVTVIDQDVRYGAAVHAAMAGCEYVVHLAADSINKSQADPYGSVSVNMDGAHNVFAAAADHGVKRVVFASSASVYGDPEKLPMHEDDKLNPLTPYCIGKRTGEDLLGYYQRKTGLSWIALRFFNVYGEGQKVTAYYTSVINHFVNRLKNGEAPVIDGEGKQSMDFIHVVDIARAVVMALESEQANVPINVGTGIDTSIAELAEILIDAVGVDVKPQFNPRDVLVSRRAADVTRAREILGFEPTIEVGAGMKRLIENS
ncbi:NAD-dependent epimerase/dehydratase family protein [Aeromicrobium wangtongii]|uniref:NAD-dependent epimerase/dehydratase family protein n=1 Tax=Aeromicrobium wangtongii TaxID=2969247 RepID=A0ABY5MAE1_9ACTN|nr:NAD-dependent epimerase/dehydratase family protein [Aeromicrobium wangtongii]MCD9199581.1 NAD-dependent epimerase/dehydratase family protein [Aeromicrobium wangtongii]UUP13934.1 NAD-dependent epimerase/dehydratase family protein [Aeromicrobium wangtongii]